MRAVVSTMEKTLPAKIEAILPGAVRKAQKDGRL